MRKAPRATPDRSMESPGAAAIANPMNTTLPVMLAVNTCPSATQLTASTNPVTAVRARSRAGRRRSGAGAFIVYSCIIQPEHASLQREARAAQRLRTRPEQGNDQWTCDRPLHAGAAERPLGHLPAPPGAHSRPQGLDAPFPSRLPSPVPDR